MALYKQNKQLQIMYIKEWCLELHNGTLKVIRDEMFEKMQKLPIKFFDIRTNGDIMSYYTNDVDTLSQNLNQSITQIITAICTIIGILII